MQQANANPLTMEEIFLQLLRQRTAAQHTKLEATKISTDLLRPDATVQMYMTYLAHMRGVMAFAEHHVYPVLAHLFADISERGKLAAIDSDIETLARMTTRPATKPLPVSTEPMTTAFAMGYMYVIEGSTLGGRMLLKHVKTTLGFDEEAGARFFSGYGANTGTMWKQFLQILTGYAVGNECEEEVIAGANHAFKIIEEHFS